MDLAAALLVAVFLLSLYFALVLWMLIDTVRRGRGWIRWQVFLFFLPIVAIPVWFFRRRRWPIAVSVDRWRKLALVGIAAFIVLAPSVIGPIVTTYFFQVARVQGQAMSPTLNDQDRLVVNKRLYRTSDPAVGDIVMLRYPRNPEKSFVSRVIAAGGDEIRIVRGTVFRNGVQVDEPFVAEGNRSYDNWGPDIVPHGFYFVMGDRRNNSSDSRHWGYVPREYMLGRVTIRWWPISGRRRL